MPTSSQQTIEHVEHVKVDQTKIQMAHIGKVWDKWIKTDFGNVVRAIEYKPVYVRIARAIGSTVDPNIIAKNFCWWLSSNSPHKWTVGIDIYSNGMVVGGVFCDVGSDTLGTILAK